MRRERNGSELEPLLRPKMNQEEFVVEDPNEHGVQD